MYPEGGFMKCDKQIFLLLKILRSRKEGKCGTVGGRQRRN